jgi:endonuclease YncB( thermonuclease family)
MIRKILLIAALLLALAAQSSSQDYASGIVTSIVDGDSFHVDGFGLVSLAHVNSPEMGCIEAVHAREYSMERLLNVVVFLDRDDQGGTYPDGGIPCMVYLSNQTGGPNLNKSYNKMVIEAGYGVITSSTPSKFDPALW